MRVEKSIKNTGISVFFHIISLLVNFIVRFFFIKYLGSQYLGLNGLLTNILQVLSLAELGVGEAINYSLYKPIAKSDKEKCKSLMYLYKKIYIFLGIFITVAGIIFMPFLHLFIKDMNGLKNVYIIYILFVLNTSVSYFYSYRWNLMVADQKKYIVNMYRYSIYSLFKLFQIVYLIYMKDLVGYMAIQVTSTFIENLVLSEIAKRKYSLLKEKNIQQLDKNDKDNIKKNVKAMMMHKIGNTVINSTDNIIISKFVGLLEVGIYSNYYMIINSVNVIFGQAYSALTSSIGNLYAESDEQKEYDIFKKINFLTFWIYSVSSIVMVCVINQFIELWTGKNYMFPAEIVYLLIVNFYINGMRKAVMTFREASGLFYKDRWKAVIEAFVNLVISIILALKFGTIGVFFGTLISAISVSVWLEPYILYRYSFKESIRKYFWEYFKYIFFTIITSILLGEICSYIRCGLLVGFILKSIVSVILSNVFIIAIFHNSNEFKYVYENIIKKMIKKLQKGVSK